MRTFTNLKILIRRAALSLFAFMLAFSSLPASASEEEPLTGTAFFLDTVTTLTIYGSTDETLLTRCWDLLDEYENLFSRSIEGSDVWNINHSEGKPTTVSDETAFLIETSLTYSELSDGAFDITITPIVDLWDVLNNPGIIPTDDEIDAALAHVGYEAITVDNNTVTLSDPEAQIDLGGIAKGYIADALAEFLKSEGIQSALINLGGDVQAIGKKPDGSDWNVGVLRPFGEVSDIIAVVQCDGDSLVTSGTYERYFEVDGKIYHHIMDPQSGRPTDNNLTSVSILSSSSMLGDTLSTTCFVLGLEEGMKLIESLDGFEALFITEDEAIFRSSGFPED